MIITRKENSNQFYSRNCGTYQASELIAGFGIAIELDCVRGGVENNGTDGLAESVKRSSEEDDAC